MLLKQNMFQKILILLCVFHLIISCTTPPLVQTPEQTPQKASPERPLLKPPKIGLVLGPGGLRSFAHLGVIKELERHKIPISAVVGIGWGALIAGLYATKGTSHHVEWQLSKLKQEHVSNKSFFQLQKKMAQVSRMQSYLKDIFSQTSQTTLPFACPTKSLQTEKQYLLNKGRLQNRLEKCLPIPPIFAPYRGWTAYFLGFSTIQKWMTSLGVNVIIYVDLLAKSRMARWPLAQKPTIQILWNQIKSLGIMDATTLKYKVYIDIPQKYKGLLDFASRNHYAIIGQKAGRQLAQKLAQEYGF